MSDLVSVIMPARNAGEFIRESIESILQQTYTNIELIVVDDQSTDSTREIVESIADNRVIIVSGEAEGIASAFNVGLAQAKGKYFCRCDADDLYPSDRLRKQVDLLNEHSELIAVCGQHSSIDEKNRHVVQYNLGSIDELQDDKLKQAITKTHFNTFLVRTHILKKIGGCRSFFVTAEDIDLQLRLSEQGSIYFVAENTYLYRLHNLSITHTQPNTQRLFYDKFARQCHKQRMETGRDQVMAGILPEIPSKEEKSQHRSENQILNQLVSESWYWHGRGEKKRSLQSGMKLVRLFPLNWLSWKALVLLLFKPAGNS